ncbi:hypothetical protein B9Z55_026819 [Caenorhabditis nigoni]|uniref:Zinc finger PHD-type domain-containing protein n=1 Tax=Caenorhabditis nigoni TaxID=1611254 RepID=A0A2G5SHF3_9PELO|nr:hypothetical protein B9Z55_026819 [Caenorhabditis nigoni]
MPWIHVRMGLVSRIVDRANKANGELERVRKQMSQSKMMFHGNLKLVREERDKMKGMLKEALHGNMVLSRENEDLRQKLSIAEKQVKILTRDVERLSTENRKRKSELYQSKEKEKEKLAKEREKWEKQQKPCRKPFDSLTNYFAQKSRTDEGQEDSEHFYMHIIKELDRRMVHKSLFTPLEAFCIYHSLEWTRQMYSELKRWYKTLGMLDPFPSLEQVKKVEDSVGSKELFTVEEKRVVGAKGEKLVTVVQLNNVVEYVTTRVQQLYDSEKLEFPDGCKGKLWLAVMGDKGSEEVKLCLAIGNVARPNSCHHLIPLGYYTDDENSATLLEHLGNVVEQVNQLTSVTIETRSGPLTIKIQQFLGGDMKFMYEMLGHQGGSSTLSCMKCYAPGRGVCMHAYVPRSPVERRSIDSYASDSLKKGLARKNVKEGSMVVFPQISTDNLIPSTLHILMGLCQKFAFDELKQMANEQDKAGVPKYSEKEKKKHEAAIAKLEEEVEVVSSDLKAMECIDGALENFLACRIDASQIDTDQECLAKMCLFRDRSMENSSSHGFQKDVCSGCKKLIHGVCGGIWIQQQWDQYHSPDYVFLCFHCQGLTGPRIQHQSKQTLTFLEKEKLEIEEKLKVATEEYDHVSSLWKGKGNTRKRLDNIWKTLGAVPSPHKQTFTGNHTIRLLKEAAIEKYCDIFPPSSKLSHIKEFLKNMGKFALLCVPRDLTDDEIVELDECIKNAFENVRHSSPQAFVTPKMHFLLEHTVEFAIQHRSIARTSEQGLEAIHRALNRMKLRYSTVPHNKERHTLCFRSLLYRNYSSDLN